MSPRRKKILSHIKTNKTLYVDTILYLDIVYGIQVSYVYAIYVIKCILCWDSGGSKSLLEQEIEQGQASTGSP